MELLRKAENLTEAYQVLVPDQPLQGEWLERFYAERPEHASIANLVDQLRSLDPRDDDKTLFTGHRGSGKTTELARLEQALEPTHTVVRLDAGRLLNIGDVDYADLLVMLGLQVFQEAKHRGMKLNEQRSNDLLFWYATRVFEEDERRRLESEVGGELDAVIAKFSLKLTTDAPRRQTVRREAKSYLSDLLERLNALLDDLQGKTGRRTLVLVDDLDKMLDLTQVRDLFHDGASALMAPHCRVVYTVPLAIYNTNDLHQVRMSFARNFVLPNIKTVERDGSLCREGREALLKVLACRLMPGLLAPEADERLVDLSGGLLKELISLARDAVLRARRLRGEQGPVQLDDVEYAAGQLRNTYRASLTEEQYHELWRIYQGGPFTNSQVARDLLHNLSLLEYDGGKSWWGIHPIVRPLLEERADEFRQAG